jgi:ribosomal-protein-alanine N-acetyltransferase
MPTGPVGVKVLQTERLVLRWLRADDADAAFILQLVNEPLWLRYIGDRNLRTIADARGYIENGPVAMYRRLGFGLYLVALEETGESIGICGLIKRDTLQDVDVGFAFLSAFHNKGYARESAAAVIEHAREAFRLKRLLAIASPDNEASHRLLEKLGFRLERKTQLTPDASEVNVYVRRLADDSVAAVYDGRQSGG